MTFAESVKTCLGSKYCQFKGRASRSEYWWFSVLVGLINLVSSLLAAILPQMVAATISMILAAGVFLPNISVSVRRLHDRNMRGWWLLVPILSLFSWAITRAEASTMVISSLLSVCMSVALLVIFCLRGTVGPNRFGPDPLAREEWQEKISDGESGQ